MNLSKCGWLFITFIVLEVTHVTCKVGPIVPTTKGLVQGEIFKTVEKRMKYASFRGIPYAEPPIGDRRFKPPAEKKPWTHILQATADGNNCAQHDYLVGTFTGSEDCLYLNVYTPKTNFKTRGLSKLLPVMVWIYGGKFLHGYANSSVYGPDFIVEKNVILVTFNYRLGPLGFLNLNHENAMGNAALKDQNAVLKWVNNNIRGFGGDPNNVTIFGQSAGASSVDFHVLSEMSHGLFHKSISMSGSALIDWSFQLPEEAEKKAFELGKRLGTKTKNKEKLLRVLHQASAKDLMLIAQKMGTVNPAFRPTIESTKIALNEEKFLTECPKKKYETGRFYKGPHIMGIMKRECIQFADKASAFLNKLRHDEKARKKGFWVNLMLKTKDTIRKISKKTINSIYNVATKFFFIFGIDKKQRMMVRNNDNPVFYYQISVDPEYSLHKHLWNVTNIDGAAHGDDILYLFYTNLLDIPMDSDNLLTITRKRVVELWTNFAKNGNPNAADKTDSIWRFTWPSSGEHGAYLDIGVHLNVIDNRFKMFTKFWKQLFNLINDDTC